MKKTMFRLVFLMAAVLMAALAYYHIPGVHDAADLVGGILFPASHGSMATAGLGAPFILMALTFQDIDPIEDVDNTGGTQIIAYFIPRTDIQSFPDMPADTGNMEDLAEITGNIVMKANKHALAIYSTQETGEIAYELQGELDGQSYRSKYSFFTPKNGKKQLGLARAKKNIGGVWIVLEAGGQMRIIGHPGYWARLITNAGGTGQGTAGKNGQTMTVESVWGGPAPIFSGKVDLTGTGYDSTGTDYQDLVYGD